MKTTRFALAAGLTVALSATAFAAPLPSVMHIGDGTAIHVIDTARTGSIEASRAAAIAGGDVAELKFVGMPTNPFLEDELDDEGYEIADLVKLYTDMNGGVWAFVDADEPEEEKERIYAVLLDR